MREKSLRGGVTTIRKDTKFGEDREPSGSSTRRLDKSWQPKGLRRQNSGT